MKYSSAVRKIELRFAARDLVNKDLFSLSDPFLVCHTVRDGQPCREIGRTETVQDDLNPVWATTFSFDYDPSAHHATLLVVDLFDRDSRDSGTLSKHDFLGRAFFRLADLLAAPYLRLDIQLQAARPGALLPPPGVSSAASSLTDDGDEDDDDDDDDDDDGSKGSGGKGEGADDVGDYKGESNRRRRGIDAAAGGMLLRNGPFVPPAPSSVGSAFHDMSSTSESSYRSSASAGKSSGASARTRCQAQARESVAAGELARATRGCRAGKVRGFVSVFAEVITPPALLPSNGRVRLRVRSALLRDAHSLSSALCGFRVTQFYEVQRERREGARTSWSCVYRSADGVRVDRHNYVVFDDVTIEEAALANGLHERKLRIAFFRRHTRSPHRLISYVTTSLAQLRGQAWNQKRVRSGGGGGGVGVSEDKSNDADGNGVGCGGADADDADVQEVALKMEGEFGDDDGLGSVLVRNVSLRSVAPQVERLSSATGGESELRARDDDFAIILRADHFLNRKFISSLNDAPKHERRLRQKPAFITLH